MDFTFTDAEKAWREEVRQFLKEEMKKDWKLEAEDDGYGFGAWSDAFVRRMAEKGWIGLTWPQQYGGKGRSLMDLFILFDEIAYYRAPGAAIWANESFCLPILAHGSEELKKEFLPRVARGEITMWEGFSEPNAGSDLLSLMTSAVTDGDYWVINGQKTWNSYGHCANWGYTAARTDPTAPRHKGISLFLIDMKLPGVSVRPLPDMSGGHCFAEIFFDNVRVPKRYLLGEKNAGFPLILAGLEGDRFWGRCQKHSYLRRMLEEIVEYCRQTRGDDGRPMSEDPVIRRRLADAAVELDVSRLFAYRAAAKMVSGKTPTYEASVLKTFADEMGQRFTIAAMSVLGLRGQLEEGSKWAPLDGYVERALLTSIGHTIAGGTSEIQRNTIARFGLELPSK